jgi:hypothetical protein
MFRRTDELYLKKVTEDYSLLRCEAMLFDRDQRFRITWCFHFRVKTILKRQYLPTKLLTSGIPEHRNLYHNVVCIFSDFIEMQQMLNYIGCPRRKGQSVFWEVIISAILSKKKKKSVCVHVFYRERFP